MTVMSTNRVAFGAVALGTGGVALILWHLTQRAKEELECNNKMRNEVAMKDEARSGEHESHQVKSRVGNFKLSKLKRIVDTIAEECGMDIRLDMSTGNLKQTLLDDDDEDDDGSHEPSSIPMDTASLSLWDEQIKREKRAVEDAAAFLHHVRESAVHKKLPHFYVVDRQLEQAAAQLREIGSEILEFWRFGRDVPMQELLKIPIMQLALNGHEAIVPVTQGFVKLAGTHTAEEDDALLGADGGASKEQVVSAFRFRARELHKHGECIDKDAFHALSDAHDRSVARRSGPVTSKYSGDILAHYVLIGTDPRESRYAEPAVAILDATHREVLLRKIDVLRNWGETGGSCTGLGQG